MSAGVQTICPGNRLVTHTHTPACVSEEAIVFLALLFYYNFISVFAFDHMLLIDKQRVCTRLGFFVWYKSAAFVFS